MAKLLNKCPFSLFLVWILVSIGALAGVIPGCQSIKPVPPPELAIPIANVDKSVAEIDVRAKYIHDLNDRVVGDANKLLKSLVASESISIQTNVQEAQQRIQEVVSANRQVTVQFDKAASQYKALQLEDSRKAAYIAKLEKQVFSPFQIKWFWRILIGYTIFQVAFGFLVGGSPVGWVQGVGKFFVRLFPAMNIASHIRDWRLARITSVPVAK